MSQVISIGNLDRVADFITESLIDNSCKGEMKSDSFFECFIFNNQVFISGTENSRNTFNYIDIVRNAIKDISYPELSQIDYNDKRLKPKIKELGYNHNMLDLKYDTVSIINSVISIGSGIHRGIDEQNRIDIFNYSQSFAYACIDTPNLTSIEYFISKKLTEYICNLRSANYQNILPDNKLITIIEYNDKDIATKIKSIIISINTKDNSLNIDDVKNELITRFKNDYPQFNNLFVDNSKIKIKIENNIFRKTGVSGRYTMQNYYLANTNISVVGKAINSAERYCNFVANYAAKSIVNRKLALKVTLNYSINPSNRKGEFIINTHNTNLTKFTDNELSEMLETLIDISEENLIKKYNMLKPNYANFYKL